MIPIRDDAPRVNTPYINYFLLALNVVVFFFEIGLDPNSRSQFVYQFGLVPSRVGTYMHAGQSAALTGAFFPFLSSMFLHASWLHLIFNMWALWIFGDNVEDHVGHFPYLLLYLLAGLLGSAAHMAFNLGSSVPSVGASGAIAGVMGAYFLLFPSARVLTLIPLFIYWPIVWLPAWLVLGYWFAVQFISGAATAITYSRETGGGGGGVAFWAHVGGFLGGVLLIKLFPARKQRYGSPAW